MGGDYREPAENGKVQLRMHRCQGGYNDAGHVRNFLESMRSREKPVADLETVGHPTSLLCHLGNIAWRAGCTIHFDPDTYTLAEAEARPFLVRPEYRKPWVLPEV